MRTRRGVLAVLGWVAAAVLACSGALAIVAWLGNSISAPAPNSMSAEDVNRALSTASAPEPEPAGSDASPEPGPTGSEPPPSPPDTGSTQPAPAPTTTKPAAPQPTVKVHASGTVGARCVGGRPSIAYANPAQGYKDDGVDDDGDDDDDDGGGGAGGGPGTLTLKFSSENSEALFSVRCSAGKAVINVTTKADD